MLQLPTPHDGKLWLPPRAIIKPPRRPHRKRSKLAMPSWYIAGNERFRGSVPVSAGFSPANISGLLAWYKSDTQVFSDQAGTTPATNRGHVRLWKDQSGNGNDISDASTGPFFATNQISGLAALQFRSSSNTFLTNSFFPIGTGSVSSCFA